MDRSQFMIKAKKSLSSVRGVTLTVEERRESAIELASLMLKEATQHQSPKEKKRQLQLSHMMNDDSGKVFTTSMTDQCFRSQNPSRVADQILYLLKKYGIPNYLSFSKKTSLQLFKLFGSHLSKLFVPLTKRMVRKETATVILPGEEKELSHHMQQRRKENVRINLNRLGEAILGEEEANRRLQLYLRDLENPSVEYISVKISTICSQINLLAWEETLAILSDRLKLLFRAAKKNHYTRADGTKVPKFVNLDMEEYRDLHITVDLFRRVLDDSEFFGHSAGIVLQSYLPDSFLIQQELTIWAMRRLALGGAPIKIRIVKGANLAMEQVEASIRGWQQAPFLDKEHVDANFKRMVIYGCQFEHARAAHLGIGSHNLFDIAYALLLRSENKVERYVGFEMLEGMADPIRRVVQALAGDMLLYCPAATDEEFQNAVAYLVRRLDENTSQENFLRHAFEMKPDSKEWHKQASLFSSACFSANSLSLSPRRVQNRFLFPHKDDSQECFRNEPDTDWALPQNRKWAEGLIKEWSQKKFSPIPLVIGGEEVQATENIGKGEDPSFPGQELYTYTLGNEHQAETALQKAQETKRSWGTTPVRERSRLLAQVAEGLKRQRGELIGAMVSDTGKTVIEADIEVSEAIDFAEYYRRNIEELSLIDDIQWNPKGVVLVAPPWNFPCSISTGNLVAAIATGNCVIFKPASESVLVGWLLANIFWDAGIDKNVLQFFTCEDEPVGSLLVKDPRIDVILLTGATATAKLLMKLRPGLDLIAETGGKNAIIMTSLADRDLAVKDLIQSAFGHSGQKCSACSLLICEAEVYDDPHFRNHLKDAVSSITVGSPWQLNTRLGPLIHEPNQTLLKGLTTLEEGEEWLLEPRQDKQNPNLWSPGIKLGVKPGSFTHQTEFFGPVLGMMRADNLQHAIELANGTPYGLTSGLHSLDEREQKIWAKNIVAGNCYINRTITGAVVQRQPFGGCKDSSFGKGLKAGGPNYLIQLMHPKQVKLPEEKEWIEGALLTLTQKAEILGFSEKQTHLLKASLGSYSFFWIHYFSKKHDPSQLVGQDNLLKYVPQTKMAFRVQENDDWLDILRVLSAAYIVGVALEISVPLQNSKASFLKETLTTFPDMKLIEESPERFMTRLNAIDRLRLLSEPNEELRQALAESAVNAITDPVIANGRLELLNYLREVSFSIDYHRYGNLGPREGEARIPYEKAACGSCFCKTVKS